MRQKYAVQLKGMKEDFLLLHSVSIKNLELVKAILDEQDNFDTIRKSKELDWNVRQLSEQIEQNCFKILSLQQPLAKDLRFIVAVLKNTTDFERISRDSLHSIEELSAILPRLKKEHIQLIIQMVDSICHMMEVLNLALETESVANPKKLSEIDSIVDEAYDKVMDSITKDFEVNANRLPEMISLASLVRYLERVGDHICNIAERWYYTLKAERIVIK